MSNLSYLYDIIFSPVNTEKTQKQLADNKFTFLVDRKASKKDIIQAMKQIFDVEVESVNVINTEGKIKKYRGKIGKRSDTRKAVISIKKGQEINYAKLEEK
jgi:large subunit ribosomal protein L23